MSTIQVKDGTTIYYKDWGKGPVVTFSHGWPLNSDAWDGQMLFLVQNGYRCVAVDRRGHGRSSQPSMGNDMDGYADDLAAVIESLDLNNATLIGHSTGGGEVARYIARHGRKRVAGAVLLAAVPPIMLKTPANPEGLPIEVFDAIRAGVANDRSQFLQRTCRAVLWSQQAGSQSVSRHTGSVLALEHAVGRLERIRVRKSIFRDGFLRRFEEVRVSNACSARRR